MQSVIRKLFIAVLLLSAVQVNAQQDELFIPRNIQKAYQNNTRTVAGTPGKKFWKNFAEYFIQVKFNPKTLMLEGKQIITYYNNSPDTLKKLVFRIAPDFYKKGNERNRIIEADDVTDGVNFTNCIIDANKVDVNNPMQVKHEGTIMEIKVKGIEPRGGRTTVEMDWNYKLNLNSHERTGVIDIGSYFIAYFFPRITVYDDVDGWDEFPYLGQQETYFDNASFNVHITVPRNFMVWATGDLQNPAEVLHESVLKKWTMAQQSSKPVFLIDSADIRNNTVTQHKKFNTFQFKCTTPDFVFALSNHYLWQARNMVVDSLTMRKALISTAFNPIHKDFFEVNDFTAKTIEVMCFDFPGVAYPYSHLTVVDGRDQMEYPMMINDNPTTTRFDGITLTTHEVFHQIFPFLMATNQTKYAFMDEGWATLGEWYISPLIDTTIVDDYGMDRINSDLGKDWDAPMITNSTELTKSLFINSYPKPALTFLYLWEMLGDSLFKKSLQQYIITWMDKSPTPWDFFYSMNQSCGMDLNWFWKAWYFEQGYPDLGIIGINRLNYSYTVTIKSIGNKPVPIHLTATFADGSKKKYTRTVEIWKNKNITDVIIDTQQAITKLELGDVYDADIDKSNNIFVPKE